MSIDSKNYLKFLATLSFIWTVPIVTRPRLYFSWLSIVNYINDQHEAYLKDESGFNRRNICDNRVHCCLYFVNAGGHGLKPLDIAIMKNLQDKVNFY